MTRVRVAGVDFFASDVTWTHGERGCKDAAFSLPRPRGRRVALLDGRPLVEVLHGPIVLWSGLMAEQDWNAMRFTALGLASEAEQLQAVDSSGNPTATCSVAVAEAISDGWMVTLDASVPTTLFAADPGVNSIAALLDSQADALGQWWTVGADRVLRFVSAPSEPSYYLAPGVVTLGNASDDYYSTVFVDFLDSGSGGAPARTVRTNATAAARFGTRHFVEDATELGPISLAAAQDIGDGLLAKGRARLGWTNGVTVAASQLLRVGGVPASLARVKSHELVRIHGLFDSMAYLDGRTYLDAVIGEVTPNLAGGTVTISPLGKVAETFRENQEAQWVAIKKAG